MAEHKGLAAYFQSSATKLLRMFTLNYKLASGYVRHYGGPLVTPEWRIKIKVTNCMQQNSGRKQRTYQNTN